VCIGNVFTYGNQNFSLLTFNGNNVFVAVKDGTTTLIKDIDDTLVNYLTGAPV
jgi:hypothetical protein